MNLAKRVTQIKPSATLAVSAKAQELKAQGRTIINLSVGEPDFDTPAPIKDAAKQAMDEGYTKYTPVGGFLELRQAVCDKLKRDNNLIYSPDQILVSSGAKQSLYNAIQVLVDKGDEVIIPNPAWVSYPAMVILAEGKVVHVECTKQNRYKITAEQLEQAITPKTKLVMLNSPSNPTGMAYTRDEFEAIAKVLLKHPNIYIITDDIYEHILWAKEPFCNIVMACPDLWNRTIVINGVSKAYSMTGWRIGYAAGDTDIIKAMTKIQSQSTSNPCSISQKAAYEALTMDQECVQQMTKAFKQRHDFALAKVNELPGFHCDAADGAFYLFVDVTDAINKLNLKDDIEFATHLLEQADVAVIPGSAFGAPGHIRLSIALSIDSLDNAFANIAKAL